MTSPFLNSLQTSTVNSHLAQLGQDYRAIAEKDEAHDPHTFVALFNPTGAFCGELIVNNDGTFANDD